MSIVDTEDPEVSLVRYHDRYMAAMRSRYEDGRMEGKRRFLQKIKEQNDAIQEKDRLIAEKNREIEELKARLRAMRESMKGNT